jgi:hypothetical protein
MADAAKISVKDFLSEQKQATTAFLATLEATSDAERVKVTPWRSEAGCLCSLAFEVPLTAIASVKKTGDVHVCCGKRLAVVEVEFAPTHHATAEIVSQQVTATTASASHALGHQHPQASANAGTAAFASPFARGSRSPWCDADCAAACGICWSTGKPGPCGVCYQCKIHGCPIVHDLSTPSPRRPLCACPKGYDPYWLPGCSGPPEDWSVSQRSRLRRIARTARLGAVTPWRRLAWPGGASGQRRRPQDGPTEAAFRLEDARPRRDAPGVWVSSLPIRLRDLAERPSAQDGALPIWRAATRRARRDVGRLAERVEEAVDAARLGQHRD